MWKQVTLNVASNVYIRLESISKITKYKKDGHTNKPLLFKYIPSFPQSSVKFLVLKILCTTSSVHLHFYHKVIWEARVKMSPPLKILFALVGKRVAIKLKSGPIYKSTFTSIDNCMNLTLNDTAEYIDGIKKSKKLHPYWICFIYLLHFLEGNLGQVKIELNTVLYMKGLGSPKDLKDEEETGF